MHHKNMQYVRIIQTPYRHNQLEDIKENPQNDLKMLCSSSLAIIWRLLLCIQSFRNKTHKKCIKKENTPGNKLQVKGKQPFFLPMIWSTKPS